MKEYRFLVGGSWLTSNESIVVEQPFTGEVYATVPLASQNHVEVAVRKAYTAFDTTREISSHSRSRILLNIGNQIIKRKQEFIDIMVNEAGKTLREAREELAAAVFTFRAASDIVLTLPSGSFPADITREGEGLMGFSRRFPVGPVLGIASFNFPLNGLARKIAPAIATGNPFIIVPAVETPVTALLLGEILLASGYPEDAISILPCSEENLDWMVGCEQIKVISYCGNSEKGWQIKAASGKKKVLLQMSNVGVTVVNKDADLEYAAQCCVPGAFRNAGQLDSSLQRILVHEDVFFQFLGKFIKKTNQLVAGDPSNAETDVGPVINENAAARIEKWIKDAVAQGADLVSGGSRNGAVIQPTVFLEATEDMLICQKEVFGPVVAITPVADIEQAVWTVFDMEYGLQTSIFTNDLGLAMKAYRYLDVGTVLINELPTFRVATIPHGGKKDSSFGRESVIDSVMLMTEEKLLLIKEKK